MSGFDAWDVQANTIHGNMVVACNTVYNVVITVNFKFSQKNIHLGIRTIFHTDNVDNVFSFSQCSMPMLCIRFCCFSYAPIECMSIEYLYSLTTINGTNHENNRIEWFPFRFYCQQCYATITENWKKCRKFPFHSSLCEITLSWMMPMWIRTAKSENKTTQYICRKSSWNTS